MKAISLRMLLHRLDVRRRQRKRLLAMWHDPVDASGRTLRRHLSPALSGKVRGAYRWRSILCEVWSYVCNGSTTRRRVRITNRHLVLVSVGTPQEVGGRQVHIMVNISHPIVDWSHLLHVERHQRMADVLVQWIRCKTVAVILVPCRQELHATADSPDVWF